MIRGRDLIFAVVRRYLATPSARARSRHGAVIAAAAPSTPPSTCGGRGTGSVSRVLRQCSRPGCAEPAAATLTYVYARQEAFLDDLSRERDPHGYDLCARHAARVRVPNGWHLADRLSELLSRLAG